MDGKYDGPLLVFTVGVTVVGGIVGNTVIGVVGKLVGTEVVTLEGSFDGAPEEG